MKYQTKMACGGLPPCQVKWAGRQVRAQERQRAVLRHQEDEQEREAEVHEDELHLVGEDHGAQPALVDVEDRQQRRRQDAGRQRQAEHGGEQRAEHEHVGGGLRHDEHRERAHERRPAAVGAVEQVGQRVEPGVPRALREEDGEEQRADVVGHAEDQPVGEPVAPRVLAHAEDAAVPGGDQRGDQRGQRDAPSGHEVVERARGGARRRPPRPRRGSRNRGGSTPSRGGSC